MGDESARALLRAQLVREQQAINENEQPEPQVEQLSPEQTFAAAESDG